MKESKHGFEPKQEFTMGSIAWTVIQTGEDWVKCIASECVEERAFDEKNKNDFAASDIRAYLNGDFFRRLIKAGAPEEMFEYFNIDLTADDGLKNYGGDRVRIGLITCDEYRLLREHIPALPNDWWWTATADSPNNPFVRYVNTGGTLDCINACNGYRGIRPLCNLKPEILVSYLNGENVEEQKKRAKVVHGQWLNFYNDFTVAECDQCASQFEVVFNGEANGALRNGFKQFYKYCPNCGAKMDKEETNELD